MTTLLDANVLIALLVADHTHHDAADLWLAGHTDPWATCPITEGSAVRALVRGGMSADRTRGVLARLVDDRRHTFWPDDVPYRDVSMASVIGHRQVTDAYLAQLARANNGTLATFDRGLAASHPDVVDLIPA